MGFKKKMKREFKIGDKVKRVRGSSTTLKIGRIYTISAFSESREEIGVKEIPDSTDSPGWNLSNFVLTCPDWRRILKRKRVKRCLK